MDRLVDTLGNGFDVDQDKVNFALSGRSDLSILLVDSLLKLRQCLHNFQVNWCLDCHHGRSSSVSMLHRSGGSVT